MTSNANPNLDYRPLEGYDVTGDQVVVAEIDSTSVATDHGIVHGKLATSGSGGGSGGGTQYTDGGTPPTNPIGNALVFDNSGTWKDVGIDFPFPTAQQGALPAGTNVIGHVIVDSAGSVSVTSLPVLPAGTNVIGHVIIDSASNVAVTALPALPAGANAIGTVGVTSLPALPTGANAIGTVGITSLPALPAGTNVIGHVIVDSAGSVSVTSLPALPAGTNVIGHVIVDSASSVAVTSLPALPAGSNAIGTVTANAGTGNMGSNLTQVAGNAIATGNNAVPVLNSASAGPVAAYGSNAAALTANTDYSFKWGAGGTTQVNRVLISNNTGSNISWDDSAATTAGSDILATGQKLFLDVQTANFHLQATGTPNVNGSSSNNIVVKGWL